MISGIEEMEETEEEVTEGEVTEEEGIEGEDQEENLFLMITDQEIDTDLRQIRREDKFLLEM